MAMTRSAHLVILQGSSGIVLKAHLRDGGKLFVFVLSMPVHEQERCKSEH